jgi:hypothetical protein
MFPGVRLAHRAIPAFLCAAQCASALATPPYGAERAFSPEDFASRPHPSRYHPEFDSDLSAFRPPLAWEAAAATRKASLRALGGSVSSENLASDFLLEARSRHARARAETFDDGARRSPRGLWLEAGGAPFEPLPELVASIVGAPSFYKPEADIGAALAWRSDGGALSPLDPARALGGNAFEARVFATRVDAPKERQGRGTDSFGRGARPYALGASWRALDASTSTWTSATVRYDTPTTVRHESARRFS